MTSKVIAKYATLILQPYVNRSEHLSYGLVVFLPSGGVRVHVASGLKKLRTFFPRIDLEEIRDQEYSIPNLVGNSSIEKSLRILNAMRILRDHKENELGQFQFADQSEYQWHVDLALNSQVEPTPGTKQTREPKSRLFIDVRDKFKVIGILAKSKIELPDHQVVEHYSPDPEADVKVEFALQNGKLRIAQTIDLRADAHAISAAHKNAAYSKAYALHYANTLLDASALESYAIVAGTHTDAAKKIMAAVKPSVDHVLAWESANDMEGFFTEWANASGKPLPIIPPY